MNVSEKGNVMWQDRVYGEVRGSLLLPSFVTE